MLDTILNHKRAAGCIIVLGATVTIVLSVVVNRSERMGLAERPAKPDRELVSVVGGSNAKSQTRSSVINEPSAFGRSQEPTDTPLMAVSQLNSDPRRVAVTNVDGSVRGVFVGHESPTTTCLVLQDIGIGGGAGCNDASDPFAGSSLWWGTHQSNGKLTKDFTLYGIASARIASVELQFANGEALRLDLSSGNGFIYVITATQITDKELPQALVAYDDRAKQVERIALDLHFGI